MNRIIIPQEVERPSTIAVDAAFAVHSELRPGLLESAYQAGFARKLNPRRVAFQRELPIPLTYKGVGIEVGFRVDVIIEQMLLVQLKAVEQVLPVHKAQVITSLKLTNRPLGLLINFNEVLIKNGIQRVLNLERT